MTRPLKEKIRVFLEIAVAVVLLASSIYAAESWSVVSERFHAIPRPGMLPLLLLWIPSLCLARGAARARRLSGLSRFERLALVFTAALLFSFFSSVTVHPHYFFAHWTLARNLFHSGLFIMVLGVAAGAPLLLLPSVRKRLPLLLTLLLVSVQAYIAYEFLHTTGGGTALYRDDHPSFLFRIHEMVETYPRMTSLNPWWNGGVVNAVGASSGVGAIVLPLYPLWKSLPAHLVYTPALAFYFVLLQPLLLLWGFRSVRASWTTSAAGATLGLGATNAIFIWSLHFGTIGSAFSMAFVPLFALLAFRVCVMRRSDVPTLASLAVAIFFLAQWPPCGIMAGTFALGWLFNIRRFRVKPHLRLVPVGIVVAVALLPNIFSVLQNNELLGFVNPQAAARPGDGVSAFLPQASYFLRRLVATSLAGVNPLVLFGSVAALFMARRRLNRWIWPSVVALLLLAAWGPFFARRMQLERMFLPAAMLAVIPAAVFCGRALRSDSPRLAIPQAMIIMLLLYGGFSVGQFYRSRGYAPYTTLPQGVSDFVSKVREVVPEDGRLLFYGKTVHSYGTGHIAYLPILARREMLSCDYYGFPPGMVEFDYPPRPWRESLRGIADYMRLFGATHITTSIRRRADYLRQSPLFEEIPFASQATLRAEDIANRSMAQVALFALKDPAPGRFHEGSGKVRAECGHIDVTLSPGLAHATIRYAWDPALVAENGTIYPVEVAGGIRFIGVRPAGDAPVVIRYSPARKPGPRGREAGGPGLPP